jgi:hypothetical protein
MNTYSDRPLSRSGKETLIKAVIQAISTYTMSCFQVPVGTCTSIRQAIANFWLGIEDGHKKMHMKSWDWLSAPKALGGMGFRDMVLFNQAMLGRQAWRLLTEPDSLCARVLKGRYFPDTDFWNATKPRSSSYTWRSILFGKELVQAGVRWGIGNGKNTKILHDNWIPDVSPDRVTTLNPLPTNATVDLLLDEEACTWNEEVVRDFFDDTTAAKILAVPVSRHGGDDFLSWPHARLGIYTVRSAYMLARTQRFIRKRSQSGGGLPSDMTAESSLWKKLWKSKAPGKMKITV